MNLRTAILESLQGKSLSITELEQAVRTCGVTFRRAEIRAMVWMLADDLLVNISPMSKISRGPFVSGEQFGGL